MSLHDLPPLREVISTHGLQARKALGQNFLLDLNLTAKIARMAGDLSTHDIIEIGPGPGGLTRALLLEGARKLFVIERDPRCLPALQEIAAEADGRLEIIEGDALEMNPRDLTDQPVKIVANLPYNIGTELLVRWLTTPDWPPQWQSLTLMFQKEVAERITAAPGRKAYGRLSVLAQWRTEAKIRMLLPASAFTPPPKVESAVVHLERREAPLFDADLKQLERTVATAFNQRRKMLRAALKPFGKNVEDLIRQADIDPTARAENLSVEQFCTLSRVLANY